MKKLRFQSILAVSMMAAEAVALPAPAMAQDGEAERRTVVQITPYVWASSYGGTVQPGTGAPRFRVQKSFGELLEDIDAAFFVNGLIRHDRLVLTADFSTTSSSREGIVPTGNAALPFVPAEARLKQTSFTGLVGYRAVDQEGVTMDVLAGARAWWIRPRVAVPALAVTRSAKADFVDPVAAARLNFKLSPRWSAIVYGDIGGFGAGSDVTAQGVATINAKVGRRFWISGGYRYLLVDYKSGGIRLNNRLGGPLLGVTATF